MRGLLVFLICVAAAGTCAAKGPAPQSPKWKHAEELLKAAIDFGGLEPVSMALSPDGKSLAVAAVSPADPAAKAAVRGEGDKPAAENLPANQAPRPSRILLVDAQTLKITSEIAVDHAITEIAWGPAGKRVVTLASDLVTVWDIAASKPAYALTGKQTGGPITAMATSGDGQVLALAATSLTPLTIWSLAAEKPGEPKVIRNVTVAEPVGPISLDKTGGELAVGGFHERHVQIVECATGRVLMDAVTPQGISIVRLALYPDASHIAVERSGTVDSRDERGHILKANTGEDYSRLTTTHISELPFRLFGVSPGGHWILGGSMRPLVAPAGRPLRGVPTLKTYAAIGGRWEDEIRLEGDLCAATFLDDQRVAAIIRQEAKGYELKTWRIFAGPTPQQLDAYRKALQGWMAEE